MYNIGYEGYSDPRLMPPEPRWEWELEYPTEEDMIQKYWNQACIEIMLSDEDELDMDDETLEYAIREAAYWLAKAAGEEWYSEEDIEQICQEASADALASSRWEYI